MPRRWFCLGLLSWPLLAGATDTAVVPLPALIVTAPSFVGIAPVTALDRVTLDHRQPADVVAALRGQAGVNTAHNGGPGQAASVFLRGTAANQTLLLVDGLKLGSATLGVPLWHLLPLDAIERIDLVRGPRGSLYGPEAVGGVILVTTRGRSAAPWGVRVAFEHGGAERATRSELGLTASHGPLWFNGSLGFTRARGIDACRGVAGLAGCFVNEPDDDGQRAAHLALRGGYDWGDTFKAEFNLLHSENDVDYDGDDYAGNRDDSRLHTVGARFDWQPHPRWHSQLTLGRIWDTSRIEFDRQPLDRYETRRDTLNWRNELALDARQSLTLGLDRQHERIATAARYTRDARTDWGLFGQYRGRFGRHSLELSLRRDTLDAGTTEPTGYVDWGYALTPELQLTLGYGTAIRRPTFNELYYPGYGNPALTPERSRSLEAGLGGEHTVGAWRLSLYRTSIDDLIAYDATARAPTNLDQARIDGLELWGQTRLAGWELEASATHLDARNLGGLYNGKRLPRRPARSGRLDADHAFGRWRLGGTLFVSGPRDDDLANHVRLDAFALIDLRVEYALDPTLRLYARLDNLLDREYETVAYYNQPGRAFFIGLRYGL